jgi:hypothetical protein
MLDFCACYFLFDKYPSSSTFGSHIVSLKDNGSIFIVSLSLNLWGTVKMDSLSFTEPVWKTNADELGQLSSIGKGRFFF